MNEVCGVCKYCVSGDWTYCEGVGLEGGVKKYGFGNADQGSMGTGAVWKEPYLFHIPESMASDEAAPLVRHRPENSLQKKALADVNDRCAPE